eukprot:scaffold625_cov420-Prasinococcus_capsulatus_cf.AAC.14
MQEARDRRPIEGRSRKSSRCGRQGVQRSAQGTRQGVTQSRPLSIYDIVRSATAAVPWRGLPGQHLGSRRCGLGKLSPSIVQPSPPS